MMDLGIASDMGMPAGMLQIGRWVLYDKDDMFVKAIANPGPGLNGGKLDFGVFEFSCIYVSFWDTDYVAMSYELKTGKPNACYTNFASWKEANPYFGDADCTDPVYLVAQTVTQVSGKFYYTPQSGSSVGPLYMWNAMQNTCLLSNPAFTRYAYKPVPNWALEIMDSPPYSMVLEY